MRNPLRTSAATALAVVALLATACGGSDDSEASPETAGNDSTAEPEEQPPSGKVRLEAGETTVEIIGEPIEFPAELSDEIIGRTKAYVEAATIAPLLGQPAKDFEDLFFFTIAGRVGADGSDRAALTDEAVPVAVSDLETKAEPVKIAALSNGFGGWVMVATTIDYTVEADVEGGPVTIRRTGDLYFTQNPDTNEWQISAYDLDVSRETAGTKQSDSAQAGDGTGSANQTNSADATADNSEDES